MRGLSHWWPSQPTGDPRIGADAERLGRHSHAERGNESIRGLSHWLPSQPTGDAWLGADAERGRRHSHAERENESTRGSNRWLRSQPTGDAWLGADAERRRRHSHAERGNEWCEDGVAGCRHNRLVIRGSEPTRSVSDGIPTRSVGTSQVQRPRSGGSPAAAGSTLAAHLLSTAT